MQAHDFDFLLTEATELLETADNELSRPQEDVTTHTICHKSRQALVNAMTYFLFTKDIQPHEPVTIDKLFLQCKSADKRFADIDMSEISCSDEENSDKVCFSVGKVSSCYQTAKLIHGLITDPKNAN